MKNFTDNIVCYCPDGTVINIGQPLGRFDGCEPVCVGHNTPPPAQVPEPATLALFGVALLAVAIVRRFRR